MYIHTCILKRFEGGISVHFGGYLGTFGGVSRYMVKNESLSHRGWRGLSNSNTYNTYNIIWANPCFFTKARGFALRP